MFKKDKIVSKEFSISLIELSYCALSFELAQSNDSAAQQRAVIRVRHSSAQKQHVGMKLS
jgi:hypothetical protein